MVARVTARMLQRLGYKVVVAEDGHEALALYRQRGPEIALVMLDMIMPGLSGSDTLDELRKLDPAVRVLLASGYSAEGQASELLARGCKGFVQKPYRTEELSQELRAVLAAEG